MPKSKNKGGLAYLQKKEEVASIKEDLIHQIRKHPLIWSISDKDHSDKNKVSNAWIRILDDLRDSHGELLERHDLDSVKDLKLLWKNMKDYYYKEKKKLTNRPSGSGLADVEDPKWPFFKSMDFISSAMVNLPTSSNLDNIDEEEVTDDEVTFTSVSNDKDSHHEKDMIEEDTDVEITPPSSPNIPPKKIRMDVWNPGQERRMKKKSSPQTKSAGGTEERNMNLELR